MANALEFFPFFVEKFSAATSSWPAERVGAYWLCLIYQWNHGSVPGDDIADLAIVMHEPVANAKKMWAKIQGKFPKGDHGYQNRKLEDVRTGVLQKVDAKKNRTKPATVAAAEARRTQKHLRDASVTESVTVPKTDANLKLESTENTKEPPLIPPSVEGETDPSVTDGLTEKDPTRKELADAKAIRDEFGCPHAHPEGDPPVEECEEADTCIGRLVAEKRSRLRQGLKVGAA